MNAAMELLIGSIGALGLWSLWFLAFKEYRISALREELFTLRDHLFIVAAKDEVAFDEPAYVELRQRLNDTVRFAHHVSLPALVFAIHFAKKKESADSASAWKSTLATLPEAKRQILEDVNKRMVIAFTKHLIEGSVILLLVSTVRIGWLLMLAFSKTLLKSKGESIDVQQGVILRMADTLDVDALAKQAYTDRPKSEEFDLQLA
jgi:hypothetical protein